MEALVSITVAVGLLSFWGHYFLPTKKQKIIYKKHRKVGILLFLVLGTICVLQLLK